MKLGYKSLLCTCKVLEHGWAHVHSHSTSTILRYATTSDFFFFFLFSLIFFHPLSKPPIRFYIVTISCLNNSFSLPFSLTFCCILLSLSLLFPYIVFGSHLSYSVPQICYPTACLVLLSYLSLLAIPNPM